MTFLKITLLCDSPEPGYVLLTTTVKAQRPTLPKVIALCIKSF